MDDGDAQGETEFVRPNRFQVDRVQTARKKLEGETFKLQITLKNHPVEAENLRQFLEHVWNQKEKLNGEPCVYNAYMDTYHKFLFLKAKYPDRRLYPTTEIEWVWYCHVVRPKFYIAYCESKFQKVIDHDLEDWTAGFNDPSLVQETADLYEEEFPGEKYQFTELPLIESKEIKYLETADVYNDWNWYNHIMQWEGYPGPEFMAEGEKGYHKFMATVFEEGFRFGPPVNIDLWWHAHQIKPLTYIEDCMEMYGEVIYHTPLGTVGRWQEFPSHLTCDKKE